MLGMLVEHAGDVENDAGDVENDAGVVDGLVSNNMSISQENAVKYYILLAKTQTKKSITKIQK